MEFGSSALDMDNKAFVIYIAALAKSTIISIYSFHKAQIALLISTNVPIKYFDFVNVFSSKSTTEVPEYTRINDYFINSI